VIFNFDCGGAIYYGMKLLKEIDTGQQVLDAVYITQVHCMTAGGYYD
jgi:hypothetical protein